MTTLVMLAVAIPFFGAAAGLEIAWHGATSYHAGASLRAREPAAPLGRAERETAPPASRAPERGRHRPVIRPPGRGRGAGESGQRVL